jgi:hypothetical protein
MKKISSSNVLRWIGVSVLLLSYVLVSQGIVSGEGVIYNGLSFGGSAMMITSSLLMKPKDWAVIAFNCVWATLAIVTIVTYIF